MIKTKIIATLGPASNTPEMLNALIDNGVDVFRLNFSHGTLDQHKKLLDTLNAVRKKHHLATAVMGDLCGPKIRISTIDPDGQLLSPGQLVNIEPNLKTGTINHFGTNYSNLCDDVKVGDRLLIDDGQISLEVAGEQPTHLQCRVVVGGPLHSHKGINLPDSEVSIPALTEYDWQCVDWAIEQKLDFLALSFVRTADEINELKKHIHDADSHIKVVSKIEKPQAVKNLDTIIPASDAVLVARGDLGVEMDLAHVPIIQKKITSLCRQLGKPAIVATQMLQSMIESPVPTRAEVSDVANAIMDLTDAVMLSGETAVGKYPINAVKTINDIASATETCLEENELFRPQINTEKFLVSTASISRSVAQITEDIGAKLVIAWSQTGSAAQLLSKARIDVPIIAISSDQTICRQMCLHYGVIPICLPIPNSLNDFVELTHYLVHENQWANTADQIIILAGQPLTPPGSQNTIIIQTLAPFDKK